MLINLIVHHPEALAQIIANTPAWVWGLLAALLWLGASQLFDRTAALRRVLLMPLAMTGFSVYGLASALARSAQTGAAVGIWLITAVAVTTLALWMRPGAPAGARFDSATRRFYLPGSAVPLLLIVGIFVTKYVVGVELALQPSLAADAAFAMQIAVLYGMFNGWFAARALRLLRLVPRAALQAAA